MNTNDKLTDAARQGSGIAKSAATPANGGTFASLSKDRQEAVIANLMSRPDMLEPLVREKVGSLSNSQIEAILAEIEGGKSAEKAEPTDEATGAKLHVGGEPVPKPRK